MTLYAIVRIRGTVDVPYDVEHTLKLLRLTRTYHAVIYPKSPSIDGMLSVVKDWVTWGEVSRDVLKQLILRRGRTVGGRPITEDVVKNIFKVGSIDELIDSLLEGRILWHQYDKYVKPVFRLHPPSKGFKRSLKKPYNAGGELGYRGPDINDLLIRLI